MGESHSTASAAKINVQAFIPASDVDSRFNAAMS